MANYKEELKEHRRTCETGDCTKCDFLVGAIEEEQKTISPATAMHYAETVGKMPPRYKEGERYYTFTCEGDFYKVDALRDDAPKDMHKTWAKEVNDGAKRIVFNMCTALCGSTFQTKEELNNHACYTAR